MQTISYKIIDRTGQKFGRLLVVEQVPNTPGEGSKWSCRCDCGNIVEVRANNLQSGNTKSCGCVWKEEICLPKGTAAFNQLYNRMKADTRKHGFSLTKVQVRQIVFRRCHYCGVLPAQKQGIREYGVNGGILYNGIDRVDNSIGYVEGNVVTCCGQCNRAKGILGVEEFKAWVTRIYKHSIEDKEL